MTAAFNKLTPGQTKRVRQQLRDRDGDNCHWCGEPMLFPDGKTAKLNSHQDFSTIEHLIERRNGGTNELSNLVLAHHFCNRQRDNMRLSSRDIFALAAPVAAETAIVDAQMALVSDYIAWNRDFIARLQAMQAEWAA